VSTWIESWLAGSKSEAAPEEEQDTAPPRGAELGLPERGTGSVAPLGRRLGAFVADCVVAALITALFTHPSLLDVHSMQEQNYWSLLTWFVLAVAGTGFFGCTVGMALFRIRVARLDGSGMVGVLRAILRALLVIVVIPAVVWDANNRGLHDRAVGTVVVNIR
jgi:uncharacterized RDD family membrane protein YckC